MNTVFNQEMESGGEPQFEKLYDNFYMLIDQVENCEYLFNKNDGRFVTVVEGAEPWGSKFVGGWLCEIGYRSASRSDVYIIMLDIPSTPILDTPELVVSPVWSDNTRTSLWSKTYEVDEETGADQIIIHPNGKWEYTTDS